MWQPSPIWRGAGECAPRGRARRRRLGPGAGPGEGRLAVPDHAVGRRDHDHRRPAARALPRAAVPAQRRHLLRHAEPAGGHQGCGSRVRSGEAPENVLLVDGPDDVDSVQVRDPEKVVWLSQTTLSVDETMTTVDRLRERFPALQSPPSDDICYATQNRQVAIKDVAAESELVIVVGSANSSNSVRLVEVALDAGAQAAYRVDNADEIDDAWLSGVRTVGVTSGASVPEDLVQGVIDYLGEQGFPDVEERRTTEESLMFSLPPELRRDLKNAASG